jgi:hypothetical protein
MATIKNVSNSSDVESETKPSPTSIQDVEVGKGAAVAQSENIAERTPAERALVRKQDLRIVPLSAAIYLLCYLDRSNIGMLQWDSQVRRGSSR